MATRCSDASMDIKSILFFTSFVAIVYFLVYYYFNARFVKVSTLTEKQKKWSRRALFVFIYLPMLPFFLLHRNGAALDIFSWVAFFIFGFVFILFPFSVARDIAMALYRFFSWVLTKRKRKSGAENFSNSDKEGEFISRRAFLLRSNHALLGAGIAMAGYGHTAVIRGPQLFSHDVFLPHLPAEFDGFKIVQLSDVHVGPTIKRDTVEMLVNRTNRLVPDMVAITGDLVDGSVANLRNETAPLADLHSTYGTYFVTGNHEYYSGVGEWMKETERLGMKVLMNNHDRIAISRKGGDQAKPNQRDLVIGGVPDIREGLRNAGHRYEPEKTFINADPRDVKILLAHQPYALERSLEAGVDLQLSGHTHGGQFFPWTLAVHFIYPYATGLHLHREKMWINVNRGTGYWGPPIRIGVPSEITLITLRRGPYLPLSPRSNDRDQL